MPIHDNLGTRMKEFYENIPKTKLMRRTPVAIRIDGKAFHTFTKGFMKPFDEVLIKTMQETTEYLCKNIQGCVFGYTQSDEITLILVDYQTFQTSAWFDYEVQKICSISASMATMAFNKFFVYNFEEYNRWCYESGYATKEDQELCEVYRSKLFTATFDARCFNIPKEEVCNLIYWRQLDATRNSIQMVGQANFSHTELQNKTCNMIQDMLHEQKGINWNDFPTVCKRGTAFRKVLGEPTIDAFGDSYARMEWVMDIEMPILKGDNRAYVEECIYIGEYVQWMKSFTLN